MHKSLQKVHPELQQVARWSPKIHFNKSMAWLVNSLMSVSPAPKAPQDIYIENTLIPRPNSNTKIRLRIYKQKSSTKPMPVLIWFHGGGYVIGNPEMDDPKCVDLVRELGISIVSVDYRLAPKHPFPAGLEDGYTAIQWVHSNSQQLGIDTSRLAIGGESAGGGLATAIAQLANERKEFKISFQLLIYPMLDDRTVLRADIDDSTNITWSQKSNRFGWEAYTGKHCGAEDMPDYAVPARRSDLSGLPPAWIGVGSLDIFHDENVAYANKLKKCGVECEVMIVSGAFHGFDRFSSELSVVQNFRNSQITALKKHFSL